MSGLASELSQYVQAIRNRLWLVALLVIVAVGAAHWVVGRTPIQYTAAATLLIRGPVIAPSPTLTSGAGEGSGERASSVSNDIAYLIGSRPIAERVAKRLHLPNVESVQRAIWVDTPRNTSLMRVSASSRSPEQAAELANVAAGEFVAYFSEMNRAGVTEMRRFLEDQLAQARARLEASERALLAFRETRTGFRSPTEAVGRAASAVDTVQSQLEAAMQERQVTEARLSAVRERLAREQPVIVASQTTTENPTFRQFQTHLVSLEIQRTQLAQIYTPQHPRLDQVDREIAEVRRRLLNETRTMVGEEVTQNNPVHARLLSDAVNLQLELAVIGARIEVLQSTQRRRQAELMSIPSVEAEYNRMMRENRILEANYTMLASRYPQIVLRENEAGFLPASLQLIEAATPPPTTARAAFPKAAQAAGLVGLLVGLVAALFLDAFDDRVRSARDAERALGVPVLAQIPTQGQPRTAPAPAVFAIGILIAVAIATAAAARGYIAVPAAAGDGMRSVVSTVTSWVGGPRPAGGETGVVAGGR